MNASIAWTAADVTEMAGRCNATAWAVEKLRDQIDSKLDRLAVGMICDMVVEATEDGEDANETYDDLSRLKSDLDQLFARMSKVVSVLDHMDRDGLLIG